MFLLVFDIDRQANPASVAASLKFSGEEHIHDALSHIGANDPRTHGQHVGIVMLAR